MEKVIYFQFMKISQLISQNLSKILENIYVTIQPSLSELKKKKLNNLMTCLIQFNKFFNVFVLTKQWCCVVLSSVQSLSHVRLFVTQWTAACQASLSITNSWSLLKLMSILYSADSLLYWEIKWAVRNSIVVWPQDSCHHFLPFLYPYAILSPTGVWSSTPIASGLA